MSSLHKYDKQDTIAELMQLLALPVWGKEQIENTFHLWLLSVVDKGEWRFDLREALKLSTTTIDLQGMHLIMTLIKFNSVTPEQFFEEYAKNAAQQLVKQVQLLNEYASIAITVGAHEEYKKEEYNEYRILPDFLLKFIKEEFDWEYIKSQEENIKNQMQEKGLGEFAEMLRIHVRNSDINKYRKLFEEDNLIDFLGTRESAFVIALNYSISKGKSRREAIDLNWDILMKE